MCISDWSSDVCSSDLKMTVEDLSPAIVRRFLDYVELDRHCIGATRNLRLSESHSLARFIGIHSPVHLSWCSEVRSIPFKKTTKTLVGYLDKPEMDALLASPNRRTAMGARDYALLLFLYKDRKSTRLNSSHYCASRMPSSA